MSDKFRSVAKVQPKLLILQGNCTGKEQSYEGEISMRFDDADRERGAVISGTPGVSTIALSLQWPTKKGGIAAALFVPEGCWKLD
ncbi:hypothetical protein [Mesorhizobium erdmanii]|uniref:hypothetical protein n=1 Tax=Mesorhizobium erdmanii TaxID=1777866 RepID=UPI00047B7BB2|nr:hypothetical protein [Mesorhizobium erdmanii]